jgi:predicted nucleotidyltransferase
MEKQQLYQSLKSHLLKNNVTRAAVFGSFARNEETDKSDIDVLIEVNNMTMFDILRLEDELQKICQRKIDLVEYKAVKSSIQKYVFSDLVELI